MGALFKKTLKDTLPAVLPTTVIVLLLLIFAAHADAEVITCFLAGAVLIVGGMTLFLMGAEFSMMEVGRAIGAFVVSKRNFWLVFIMSFVLGLVATVAEPDVRVLAFDVFNLSDGGIPVMLLVGVVGLGVGVFMVVAVMRILLNWNYVVTMLVCYIIAIVFAAIFVPADFFPVAFDSGGVTTGPMTVPFILAFATGVTSVMGGKKGGRDAFGMVGVASLGPIIAVLLLGAFYGTVH